MSGERIHFSRSLVVPDGIVLDEKRLSEKIEGVLDDSDCGLVTASDCSDSLRRWLACSGKTLLFSVGLAELEVRRFGERLGLIEKRPTNSGGTFLGIIYNDGRRNKVSSKLKLFRHSSPASSTVYVHLKVTW